MKKLTVFCLTLTGAVAAMAAATVESVTCRQNWPWSTELTLTYVISGAAEGEALDATFTAFSGTTPIATIAQGLTGERYGLGNGTHVVKIDPAKAFGTSNSAFGGFKVQVTLSASPANRCEALYKIFDLDTGACTDVTRADLLNDKYGSYETDYGKIGTGFTTPLSDVLIWTGVTNDVAYKTTKLVMRKINAKNVVWQSGDPSGTACYGELTLKTQYWNKLTYDYYIAVFETTLAQWLKIAGTHPSMGTEKEKNVYSQEPDDTDNVSAVNNVTVQSIYGSPVYDKVSQQLGYVVSNEKILFPTNSYLRDVGKNSVAAKMWNLTKNAGQLYEFTLPTLAEWEFACMGGNTTPLYSGKAQALTANVNELSWNAANSSGYVHKVGGKPCNAYGLYDMLGNLVESVLGIGGLNEGGETDDDGLDAEHPVVNPVGTMLTAQENSLFSCGGCWSNLCSGFGNPDNMRHASRHKGWVEGYTFRPYFGFRFVIPASADGQWAEHPTK